MCRSYSCYVLGIFLLAVATLSCEASQLQLEKSASKTVDQEINHRLPFCQGGPLETIPLNFVVLTKKLRTVSEGLMNIGPLEDLGESAGRSYFEAMVEQLNRRFVAKDGPVCGARGCIRFAYRSHAWISEVKGHECSLFENVASPSRKKHMSGSYLRKAVNQCNDQKLRSDHAINVYIYDHCKWTNKGWNCKKRTGHGAYNRQRDGVYRNYVFLDYKRVLLPGGDRELDRVRQAAEEHEMGHALGLGHLCSGNVRNTRAESNIMQSAACASSGGRRNLPFGLVNTRDLAKPDLDEDCNSDTRNGPIWDQRRRLLCIAQKTQQSWCD
jgi:hypothetical protein